MPIEVIIDWQGDATAQAIERGAARGALAAAIVFARRAQFNVSRAGLRSTKALGGKIAATIKRLGIGGKVMGSNQTMREAVGEATALSHQKGLGKIGSIVDPPGGFPRTRTGNLRRSIGSGLADNGRDAIFGVDLGLAPYGAVQEFGKVIRPRKAKALFFELFPGVWRMAKSVYVPARPYLRPAVESARQDATDAFVFAMKQELEEG